MKAQDLRIKNIVNNSNGQPITLSIYNILSLWQWELQVHKYKGDPPFMPIPLTEERLVRKLNFKIMACGVKYQRNGVKVGFSTMGVVVFMCNKRPIYLDYVHDIQNLYHSLKGEELTIKD